MKIRTTFSMAAAVAVSFAVTWHFCATRVVAQDSAVVSTAVMSGAIAVGDQPKYIGSNKCKMCHMKQYKTWKKLKHAKAVETLLPGNASEIKKKFGLDPAKDYSKDKTCLECHTVGFGKAGGYAVPTEGDKKSKRRARYTAGVGCEMCHGAGGAFVDLHTQIMKSRRKYTRDEMYAAGMTKIEETTCKRCHNERSPTIDKATYKFDYQQRLKDGVHEHYPLKQREE